MAKRTGVRSLGLTSRFGRNSVDTERAQADTDGRWRALRDRARLTGRPAPAEDDRYPTYDAGRRPARQAAAVPAVHQPPRQPVPGQTHRAPAPNPQDPAMALLRRNFGGPRVLAFANPKGGVHKTTATVLAAATVGSVRGRGVVAWDDNELRGTLGLRAGSARHARTIRHLIKELLEVENMHGDALLQEL